MIGRLALTSLIVAFCAGCALAPMTGPRLYQGGDMTFSLPEAWKITLHGGGHAFIEAPGEAVVLVRRFPVGQDPGLERFARDFSRSTQAWTPIGRIRSDGFSRPTRSGADSVLRERFTITFAGVDVPHTRTYHRRTGTTGVFYLMTQVADEDAAAAEPGFRQILDSFRAEGSRSR